MEKPDGKSMDIVAQNIEKLKEIFPDVFSEGKVDFEALEATLGEYIDRDDERYSFNWKGKARARHIAQTPSTGTLRPAPEESKNWDTTRNLYIEGDNLEVLKLLQKSCHKQVKMIYIDPPYNTGKDFVYKDNFKDNLKNYLELTGQVDAEGKKLSTNAETSGRYHSDWLNMVYPRLKLARNLLKDDGVIFISIDDNEVANLRKVCDEIFGEENFVASIVWQKRKGGGNDSYFTAVDHEYVLVYAKSVVSQNEKWRIPYLEKHDKRYKYEDEKGLFYWDTLHRGGLQSPIIYDVECPDGSVIKNGTWQISEKSFKEKLERNEVQIIQKNNSWSVQHKVYQPKGRVFRSIYSEFSNTDSSNEIKDIFGINKLFDTPKPVGLIQLFINLISAKDNDLILDFFSGSATTAHAIMQLNAEDSGNRRYILVQLPEPTDEKSEAYKAGYKNICEIGKERIRRAGEKIKEESTSGAATSVASDGTKVPTPLDVGFKVFKLDSSNIKAWDPDYEDLETSLLESIDNIKDDRTEEDLLYEILLKYGLDLTLPIEALTLAGKKVYVVGLGSLIICLDEQITLDTVEEIAKLKEKYGADDLMRVVFRDNGFKDAEVKTNAIQILKQHGIDDVKSL